MLPSRSPLVLVAVGLLLGACPQAAVEEPPSLIEQIREREERKQERRKEKPKRAAPGPYVKRAGLHIDMPYLLGKSIERLDSAAVEEQLGARISEEELPLGEKRYQHAKGELWTYEEKVYKVRRRLGHPMDVPTALGTSGFPLDIGAGIESLGEIRWNRVRGNRRVRLLKDEPEDALYSEIEVVRFFPRERG